MIFEITLQFQENTLNYTKFHELIKCYISLLEELFILFCSALGSCTKQHWKLFV